MSEDAWCKRIGDSVGKPFVIGGGDEGREGTDGRSLPVYQGSRGEMKWPDGRYTIGVNIGAGTVHRASEESVV
jgi:hypothetical protein